MMQNQVHWSIKNKKSGMILKDCNRIELQEPSTDAKTGTTLGPLVKLHPRDLLLLPTSVQVWWQRQQRLIAAALPA
jgi:hypothetical protein